MAAWWKSPASIVKWRDRASWCSPFADYNRQETLITVTFRPQGTGTVMSFRREGFATMGMRDRYGGGCGGANGSFDKLARCLTDPAAATR